MRDDSCSDLFAAPCRRKGSKRKVQAEGEGPHLHTQFARTLHGEIWARGEVSGCEVRKPSSHRKLAYQVHTYGSGCADGTQPNAPGTVLPVGAGRADRKRTDDLMISLAMKEAGVQLVSCSEHIDPSPAGKLTHGLMALIAE